jgi:hypothetical protein
MAPSLPVVLAEWARTPLDVLLKQPEEGGGACEPLGARQRALELAQVAEAKVPAFRQFLAAGGEAGEEAGGEEECGRADAPSPPTAAPAAAAACHTWQAVPFSSKQNYVQRYPLEQRCAGGALPGAGDFVHCSSGSSGEPTLWARNAFDELAVCTRWGGAAACCICDCERERCQHECPAAAAALSDRVLCCPVLLPCTAAPLRLPSPCSLLPAPFSLLPAPFSLLPSPCALIPAPFSLHPAPCTILPAPGPTGLSSCLATAGRRTSRPPWQWWPSRLAPGWGACSPPSASGISH